jgi:hypothetical protein
MRRLVDTVLAGIFGVVLGILIHLSVRDAISNSSRLEAVLLLAELIGIRGLFRVFPPLGYAVMLCLGCTAGYVLSSGRMS